MKLSKVFSVIFMGLGSILMAAAVIVCLLCRNAAPKASDVPQEARACSERLMQALEAGDFQTAGSLMYGQPELGAENAPTEPAGALAWETFRSGISCAFTGDCYMEGTEVCRDATVTVPDIPGAMEALPALARTLLEQANAGEPAEEEGSTAQTPDVDAVLEDALRQALKEAGTVDYDVKLRMIRQEGRWLVIPDKALLTAISGGLG